MKEKIAKAQLAELTAEQASDAASTCVFPERITPLKPERPSSITEREYIQLLLELGVLTCEQIARLMGTSAECVSQHRSNAHKKLGPEFSVKWKKFCQTFKTLHPSLFSSSESLPPPSNDGDEEEGYPFSSPDA